MINWDVVKKLMNCFDRSFINQHGEFIAHEKGNSFFILENCKDEMDIKCKVLEWFSRDAHKTEPFNTYKKNDEFNNFMLNGINAFLDTDFTKDDMELIYTYLGNACNHNKTIRFIESGYDLAILKERCRRINHENK